MIEPLLMKLDLRDPLHPAEREALAEGFLPPRRPAAGETLVRQGSHPDRSTLLLEGLTARVTTLPSGAQQITAIHVPGDFIDLHSFLVSNMDHSIVALSACVTTAMPHARLRDMTTRFPHLARLLWLSTLLDAAIHRQWIVAMGRQDTLAQLAHMLCELTLRLRVVGLAADHRFRLPISQADLADVLGRSRATVNVALQALRARELVSWKGAEVEILDWEGLAALAEFDPTYLQLQSMPV